MMTDRNNQLVRIIALSVILPAIAIIGMIFFADNIVIRNYDTYITSEYGSDVRDWLEHKLSIHNIKLISISIDLSHKTGYMLYSHRVSLSETVVYDVYFILYDNDSYLSVFRIARTKNHISTVIWDGERIFYKH
jgi:hypothetical protein